MSAPCIVCDKQIKGCNFDQSSDTIHYWDGGTVDVISPGYGSSHDEDLYYIALCDECITKLKDKGKIIPTRVKKRVTHFKYEQPDIKLWSKATD